MLVRAREKQSGEGNGAPLVCCFRSSRSSLFPHILPSRPVLGTLASCAFPNTEPGTLHGNQLYYQTLLLFNCSVVSNSSRPHGLQHARLPSPSLPSRLPEFAQIRIHWVGDAIQSFHPLSFPSPLPSVFPSIRVFSRVSSSYQVAKVLELQLQDQSFQWIFRIDFL